MPSYHGATIGSGTVLTTPTADGANGQVIQTDGSGQLSFTDQTTLTTMVIKEITAPYTIIAGDDGKLLEITTGSGEISFPDGVFTAGESVLIVNKGGGLVTVAGSGVPLWIYGTRTNLVGMATFVFMSSIKGWYGEGNIEA